MYSATCRQKFAASHRGNGEIDHIIILQETGISQLPNAKAFAPGYTLFATGPAQSLFQGVTVLLVNRLASSSS